MPGTEQAKKPYPKGILGETTDSPIQVLGPSDRASNDDARPLRPRGLSSMTTEVGEHGAASAVRTNHGLDDAGHTIGHRGHMGSGVEWIGRPGKRKDLAQRGRSALGQGRKRQAKLAGVVGHQDADAT